MGYGIAFVTAIIVVFLLVALSKHPGGAAPSTGGKHHPEANGLTVAEPASDQPTPQSGRTVNKVGVEASKKIPPG